ncbi:MAG: tRNA preQ1(34) S-adenosylmethionine ribosyltransferase-isomerase QueA [Eubacteriales bacterium]|nr:tRNA preQ1(34) S-adenosylmethionine ribosyltransferase-isomerase QueA [Eubacteriales bacterium]
MDKKDFYYDLPEELIAQHPAVKRDASGLLVLDGNNGEISHRIFSDIKALVKAGDCLVINDTKVIPARLTGTLESKTAAVEILLLKRLGEKRWETIVKPGRRLKKGSRAVFIQGKLECIISEILEDGNRIVDFSYEGIWEEILEQAGKIPLPPYIHRQLCDEDSKRYQTVYARNPGSAAAPTAGLHFTDDLIDDLREAGTRIAKVTLHVGLGTFRPVKTERIEDHRMHSETYHIDDETASVINSTRASGGRVIAVGTTSCRVLESVSDDKGIVYPGSGETDIFIYPGYRFKAVDAMITNFHLPESTLIMLVSAFAGRENIMRAYSEAVEKRYRFFSFGDAMFLTRRENNDFTE